MSDPAATLEDGAYMQRAYELAEQASARGDAPFGALIVGGDEVLAEARNAAHSQRDVTAHAERRAVALAWAEHDPAALAAATLYTSTEPCVMCAGAIHQAGIRRVVFGVPAVAFLAIAGRPQELLPVRELAERCGWSMEIVGPVMQDDGIRIHQEHWRAAAGS